MVILLIFVVAYAVGSESLLYPESEMTWPRLFHLPRKAYWQVFGELILEEIELRGTLDRNFVLWIVENKMFQSSSVFYVVAYCYWVSCHFHNQLFREWCVQWLSCYFHNWLFRERCVYFWKQLEALWLWHSSLSNRVWQLHCSCSAGLACHGHQCIAAQPAHSSIWVSVPSPWR